MEPFKRPRKLLFCCIYIAFRINLLPVGLSAITLTGLTLGKYFVIIHPYSYTSEVTKERLLIFIITCFAVEFSVLTLSLKIQQILPVYAVVKRTLVFLFIAFAYTRIYLVVKRYLAHNASHKIPLQRTRQE